MTILRAGARRRRSAGSARSRLRGRGRGARGHRAATPTATRGAALNLLELGASPPAATAVGHPRIDLALLRGRCSADPALRQERRGALQPHLGAAQVDAQQRSRRGGLLAGADARSRRGPAVRRAAAGALRVRGRRQRRSAGARRRDGGARRRCTSSACPRPTRRWRRRPSTWRRRPRATPSTSPTARPPKRRERDVADPVPLHLRNAPTRLMKQLDYGKGYQYAHDDADGVTGMDCLPRAPAGPAVLRADRSRVREGDRAAARGLAADQGRSAARREPG